MRAAALALTLTFLAASLAGCSGSAPVSYVDKESGYSMAYPGDWRKLSGSAGMDLKLVPADQTNPNVPRDTVLVHVETVDQPLSLETYFEAKAKAAEAAAPQVEFKETEKSFVTLNGQEARRLVYSMLGSQGRITSMVWFLVKGNRGYMILASAPTDRFDAVKPKFEEIAGHFKLEGQ
jgi:hypothetical protein